MSDFATSSDRRTRIVAVVKECRRGPKGLRHTALKCLCCYVPQALPPAFTCFVRSGRGWNRRVPVLRQSERYCEFHRDTHPERFVI
jgi:hypothetical protein